jgi:hypothetical protein
VNFGTSSTQLAEESSAPGKKLVFLLAIPAFFVGGLAGLKFDAVGMYVVWGAFAYWGYVNFLWNRNEWPIRYENWANSFLCHRCGEVFVSGKVYSLKLDNSVNSKKQKDKALKLIAVLVVLALIYYYSDKVTSQIFDGSASTESYNTETSATSAAEPSAAETVTPRDDAELERIASGVREPEQIAESDPSLTAVVTQDVQPESRSRRDSFESEGYPRAISGGRGYLQLNLETGSQGSGAYIVSVIPGGVAERAGLQSGDLISNVNGEPVAGTEALINVISKYNPGDTIEIQAIRDDWNERLIYKVRLAKSPSP